MDPGELKLTSASNIINLRTAAGLTQAELGAKLNYSDKTISKWERGEAIPDAYVLTQLAEIFGVTVDYLLSSHNKWHAHCPRLSDPRFGVQTRQTPEARPHRADRLDFRPGLLRLLG